jgi:hypothetical protein
MSALLEDGIRATVYVERSPADAFDVFTRDIDRWWQRGPRFRVGAGKSSGEQRFLAGTMRLDRGALVEEYPDGSSFELGKVTVWEPGVRLVVGWRVPNFAPDEITEVEVTFASRGSGTEVVLVHRGWSTIRADHPARHGMTDRAFTHERAMWWASLSRGFRLLAEQSGD